ncbi:MAG: tetratricopeptide repeat protein [Deltaproteobacteria bacterium]
MLMLGRQPTGLAPDDLKRYELVFAQTVKDFLPCAAVSFLGMEPAAASRHVNGPEEELPKSWEVGAGMVINQQKPVVDAERARLYLPIWNGTSLLGIAIIECGEPPLFETSVNWLLERSRLISREFLKIKQWSLDPVSGLFNGGYFLEELKALLKEKARLLGHGNGDGREHQQDAMLSPFLSLALLEIFPQRAKTGEQAAQAVVRVVACIETVIGEHLMLHHLGYGVFALILNGLSLDHSLKMGKTLLKKLRQENYLNARLGLTTIDLRKPLAEDFSFPSADQLIDQAMLALKEAAKRGPSALFNWATLENSPLFELKPPPSAVRLVFQKLVKGSSRFSIVLLRYIEEKQGGLASRKFSTLLGAHQRIPFGEDSIFVFLNGMNGAEAYNWLEELRQKLTIQKTAGDLPMADFLAGIASFPFLDYFKLQTLVNARKALMHARFLGPARQAIFDDVTLNISGDVYYNEGDLASAIREYKKGLQLNPDSINLLNSLAVCEAQMNRQAKAIAAFKKVLQLDPENFMALYNLGFACLQAGDQECSRTYFERAMAVDRDNLELALQLARLYNRQAAFVRTVELLVPFSEKPRMSGSGKGQKTDSCREQGQLNRILGEAYAGSGNRQQAIVFLQRAVRFAPNDAAALSLLGYLYGEEDEGDDIALSLCQKAVDLDGGRWENWHRLASLLQRQGALPEAMEALKKCLSLQPTEPEPFHLLGKIYEQMGKGGLAKKVRERAKRAAAGTKKG